MNPEKDQYIKTPGKCLEIDENATEKKIIAFIKREAQGFDGVVIGLSGGIDSAVSLSLAVKALGNSKVFGLIMPSGCTTHEDIKNAKKLADSLEIEHKTVDITGIFEQIRSISFSDDKIGRGNIISRIRMIMLRDFAHANKLLVLGTGNKSELSIGYFTKNGDSGVDILPIGDLYKTQVKTIAKHLKIPAEIVKKAPSAGLWAGQTDEEEIGLKYETLDKILIGLELGLSVSDISTTIKINKDIVEKISDRIMRSRHKIEPPPFPGVMKYW